MSTKTRSNGLFWTGVVVLLASVGIQAQECGPSNGTIDLAGSTTVLPIAEKWAAAYVAICPGVNVTVEGGGSSTGAGRVCDNPDKGSAVDIGDMSREWKDAEASQQADGYTFKCLMGDTNREVIQIDVAIDGLSVVTKKDGAADLCVQALGGLTLGQLRWIYSSFTYDELVASGWDESSLSNSDGDDSTHLWSELNKKCPKVEIQLAGPDDQSGTYDYMSETIFVGDGETFASAMNRTVGYFASGDDEAIAAFVADNEASLAFFGFAYYNEHTNTLSSAPIQSKEGNFVAPDPATVGDGTYNPLSRRIFMNLLKDDDSMLDTIPFLMYGLATPDGTAHVVETGYVPLPEADRDEMISRLHDCPDGSSISIAGSSTVLPIAEKWADAYMERCPKTMITVESGGSSSGAGRVCNDTARGSAVDIGDMSRDWKLTEANTADGFTFACLIGDTTRRAIQIDIAIDGLTVATKLGGAGDTCIKSLGGLTIDQLRWIFSNNTEEQLVATGWNATTAIPNSDSDDATHLWSELNKACPAVEIKIAGPDSESGTYEYMSETLFADLDNGEIFDSSRPDGFFNSTDDEALVNYLVSNENAVAFFGYAYLAEHTDALSASAIQDKAGSFVVPNAAAVADGSYNPLSRRLYMNVRDDEAVLKYTVPFVEFGLSSKGSNLIAETGYVPLPLSDVSEMVARLHGCPSPGSTNSIMVAGSTTVQPIADLWAKNYMKMCPNLQIMVEGGGSSSGAGRLCNNTEKGSPVEIGDMSRDWKLTEANTTDGYVFQCLVGYDERAAIQIEVAIDGLSVVTHKDGAADVCIHTLGGLSVDQLRWIFTSYTEEQLVATGWNASSLSNSDGDDSTHLWSELSVDCPATGIKIAGPDNESGTYEYMSETIFADLANGETFGGKGHPEGYVNSTNDNDIVAYLEANLDAIGFFGYSYYNQNKETLSAAAIENAEGTYVAPNATTVADGSYNPLSRRIYMNLLNDAQVLPLTVPFVEYGLGPVGSILVATTGYVPLPEADLAEMRNRMAEGVTSKPVPIAK